MVIFGSGLATIGGLTGYTIVPVGDAKAASMSRGTQLNKISENFIVLQIGTQYLVCLMLANKRSFAFGNGFCQTWES